MTTKHTPGPWKADTFQVVALSKPDRTYRGEPVAHTGIVGNRLSAAENIANANLIAAAPELLEVLNELLAMCERQADFNDDGDGEMLDRAKAAIAKALGTESAKV